MSKRRLRGAIRQADMPELALVEHVAGEVILVEPMRHNDDAAFRGIAEPRHNERVELPVDLFQQLDIVGVIDLDRIVIDDQIGGAASDTAVCGHRIESAPVCSLKSTGARARR